MNTKETNFSEEDQHWMKYALSLAQKAETNGEVPVGAVLVQDGQAIGEGWNAPILYHDPSAHAEMRALREAGQRRRNYRLPNTTLYVTLEPCVMCAGAILHARVSRIVFAASDYKTGACGSIVNLFEEKKLNFHAVVESGLLAEESAALLSFFFKKRRLEKRKASECPI